ncbi:MAG TPA: class I adenylate-forming enzyme family protein [Acetobacteraceae bacterium]
MCNITGPIRGITRARPDAVAVIRADGSAISYAELDRAIDRMAIHASALGLRAGDIAGLTIAGPDESLGLILALGLARIGVASAPPSLPREYLRLCFQAAAPGQPVEPGRVRFDATWLPRGSPGSDDRAVAMHPDPAAVCTVVATSGTTGEPKYVPLSHAVLTRRTYGGMRGLAQVRATRIIAVGLGGALGFACILRTLWTGGTLVLTNPRAAPAAIRRHGVSSIVASPATLREMLDALPADAAPFPMLGAIEVAGSALPTKLQRLAAGRLCPNIVSYFGSSEAGGIASAPVPRLASRPGAVGYAWPGVEIQAVDGFGNALPPGETGLLRVRGDGAAEGYLGDPAASAAHFRDGWFWSGDLGAVWPDGMVTLTGRASDLIDAGGFKVSPRVIEDALLALPLVTDAAAFGVPDGTGIEQIWAAIVARTRIDDTVLNAFCRRALPGMSPKIIVQVKALPRNENGKLLRDALVALAMRIARDDHAAAPSEAVPR